MPPVPFERFERYTEQFGISVVQTTQLVDNPPLAAYFDRVVARRNAPAAALNFVLGELSRLANESGTAVAEGKVTPEALAELIALAEAKTINSKIAKDVLARLWARGRLGQSASSSAKVWPKSPIRARSLGSSTRSSRPMPRASRSSRAGKENVLKFLVGQVMKASRGKANPTLVEQLLREKIAPR